jgi:hypothetical protein
MKRYLAGAAGALLIAAGSLAGASAAGAAPASPDHVAYCDGFVNYGTSWKANCRVDYGRSGSVTVCSDGTRIYGPLVGVGYWVFGGNCSGHGTVSSWAVYDG